jgi:hypothetical protein
LLPSIHTYGGIHSEERKGRKSQFLFTATTFKKNESGSDFQQIKDLERSLTKTKKELRQAPTSKVVHEGQN